MSWCPLLESLQLVDTNLDPALRHSACDLSNLRSLVLRVTPAWALYKPGRTANPAMAVLGLQHLVGCTGMTQLVVTGAS